MLNFNILREKLPKSKSATNTMVSFQHHVHNLTTNIEHSRDLTRTNNTKMNLEENVRISFLFNLKKKLNCVKAVSDLRFNFKILTFFAFLLLKDCCKKN